MDLAANEKQSMLISSMTLIIFMMMMMMMTFSDKDFCTISTAMLLSGRTICTYRLPHQSVHK
jgi:hypothetical protein